MEIVDIHQAELDFTRLLDQVAQGDEVVIARKGRPIARLVAISEGPRSPGSLKGKIQIAEDFDAPLPEGLAAAFRGEKG